MRLSEICHVLAHQGRTIEQIVVWDCGGQNSPVPQHYRFLLERGNRLQGGFDVTVDSHKIIHHQASNAAEYYAAYFLRA